MATSRIRVRPVDSVIGAPWPKLACRVAIFKEWDLDRMQKGNQYCALTAEQAPRRLVGDEIEFEVPNDTTWLSRVGIFQGPPGALGIYRWVIMEAGQQITIDLPISTEPRAFSEGPRRDERAELLMNDIRMRRSYGAVSVSVSYPSRPGPRTDSGGGLGYSPLEMALHLVGPGVTKENTDDYLRERLWLQAMATTLERVIIPVPLGRKRLTIAGPGFSAWTREVDIVAGEIFGPIHIELVPAGGALDFEVVDSEGLPIAYAFVQVIGPDPGYPFEGDNLILSMGNGTTGIDGRLRVDGIPRDTRRVRFMVGAQGFGAKQGEADVSDKPIRVLMSANEGRGFVAGRIVDSRGSPLGGLSVLALSEEMLRTNDWSGQRHGSSDAAGQFRITGLDSRWGRVHLSVHCDGYKGDSKVVPINQEDVELRLEPELA